MRPILPPATFHPFALGYRSAGGAHGRGLAKFALRYLRANGELEPRETRAPVGVF